MGRDSNGDSSDPQDPIGTGPAPKVVCACVLIIGNEILSGRTQDANLAFLAQGLNEAGVRLREAPIDRWLIAREAVRTPL